jgi:RNA-directed DNA polymerase
MKVYRNLFSHMVEPASLFLAWEKFCKCKRNRKDVAHFEWELEQNIFELHRELSTQTYHHDSYSGFYITDPKQRHIHKATVRDRVVHHAVFQVLNPIFEPTFIANSYSCRTGKGTHKGVEAVERMSRKVSQNYTRPCFVLKCDVRRFFDSVDHDILLDILGRRIKDADTMWLLERIVRSYISEYANLFDRKGVPIGNLTSQLFANVYMNEFDQFVKQELKIKHYARYTDDFVLLSHDRDELVSLLPKIEQFLSEHLRLSLHPNKVTLRTLHQGVDFLGIVIRPHYRVLRTKTRRRISKNMEQRIQAYNAGGG